MIPLTFLAAEAFGVPLEFVTVERDGRVTITETRVVDGCRYTITLTISERQIREALPGALSGAWAKYRREQRIKAGLQPEPKAGTLQLEPGLEALDGDDQRVKPIGGAR